jgi:PKD repeat protein
MHHKARTAPLAVLALAVLLVVVSCKSPVTKPDLNVTADKTQVRADSAVKFTAAVSPATATISWTATDGAFNQTTGAEVNWTAPHAAGSQTITAIATDGSAKDTVTKTITVTAAAQPWLLDAVEYDNTDQYDIPDLGTVFSPINFPNDEFVPAGALVESLSAEIDVNYGGDPDSIPALNIWIESPDGSRVQIRNESQSGDPTGEYPSSLFMAFKDKDVIGTWKLIVTQAEQNPVNGVIDDFWLGVKYRYQQ